MNPARNILTNLNVSQLKKLTQFSIACHLLIHYNLRVSQILRAKTEDFIPGKLCVFPAVKHSRPVVIRDLSLLNAIQKVSSLDSDLIFPFVKYHNLHRFFKANFSHLYVGKGRKKTKPSTHVFRYVNAQSSKDVAVIQEILYHKSSRSQQYYLK